MTAAQKEDKIVGENGRGAGVIKRRWEQGPKFSTATCAIQHGGFSALLRPPGYILSVLLACFYSLRRYTHTMDFSQLNSAEQAHMSKVIERKQMQDFMKMYSNLVDRCFNSCCNDFTSKALSSKEEQCVLNCTDKFLKHSERVGARFAEQNAEMMGAAQGQ